MMTKYDVIPTVPNTAHLGFTFQIKLSLACQQMSKDPPLRSPKGLFVTNRD